MSRSRAFGVVLAAIAFASCSVDHFLIHPHEAKPGIVLWSADFSHGELVAHVEGARPSGTGPFPTVLVHPEEDQTAEAMQGVIWDLAAHGYAALAFDYQRLIDGKYQRTYFAWKTAGDVTFPIDIACGYPEVDQARIGALGYSEGAVISLFLAAYEPDRIKAVVAYYPITDFPRWYAGEREGLSPRILFALARRELRSDSRARNEEEFEKMLRLSSPIYLAEYVRAPVLLMHGAEDTMALPEESERMEAQLESYGDTTKLLIVPGGERLFNFRQPEQATVAWEATLDWLKRYVGEPINASSPTLASPR